MDLIKTRDVLKLALSAKLDGSDFVSGFPCEELADGYNGIGPEFLPANVREKITELLSLFEPAALIHDMRNEYSDGTRRSFYRANDEFRENCRKLAALEYGWYNPRRYFAYHVAEILYKFVNAEDFGWKAWLQAKERHEQKISSNSAGENKGGKMNKLMMLFAVGAAILMTGCCVTKVEYEKKDTGDVSYRLYKNEHWLTTESTGIQGGMTNEGKFEFSAQGVKSSPSEEFNKTMLTYTSAFVQLAQIAAAAYNPSSTGVAAAAKAAEPAQTVVNVQPAAEASTANASASASTTAAADCADGSCTDK